MDLTGFHALEIEPATSYEPLPSNWYKCVITDTEKKPTKAMTGSYLQLTIEVIEGEYQGRKVFDQYGASYEVKGYEAALDVVAAVTGAPVAVSSAGAAGGVSVPPWKRQFFCWDGVRVTPLQEKKESENESAENQLEKIF